MGMIPDIFDKRVELDDGGHADCIAPRKKPDTNALAEDPLTSDEGLDDLSALDIALSLFEPENESGEPGDGSAAR